MNWTSCHGQIAEDDIIDAVIAIVSYYREHKKEQEFFYEFVERVGSQQLQSLLENYQIT